MIGIDVDKLLFFLTCREGTGGIIGECLTAVVANGTNTYVVLGGVLQAVDGIRHDISPRAAYL